MALSLDIEFRGIKIYKAYATVNTPSLSANKTEVIFCVDYRASPHNDPITSQMYEAPYDLEGNNPFVQAYDYLKTLEEFQGCTDV